MFAAVFHGPNDLRLEERPTPSPGPGELLVKVGADSICGTDLWEVAGRGVGCSAQWGRATRLERSRSWRVSTIRIAPDSERIESD